MVINNVLNSIVRRAWPNWNRISVKAVSPGLWRKTFVKAASDTQIISVPLARELAKSQSLLYLMLNSFSKDRSFPSAKDFAIHIAFEINQEGSAAKLVECPQLWHLRAFAEAVRKQWIMAIESHFILKQQFSALFPNTIEQLKHSGHRCLANLDVVLCHRGKLTKAFFANCDNGLYQGFNPLPNR